MFIQCTCAPPLSIATHGASVGNYFDGSLDITEDIVAVDTIDNHPSVIMAFQQVVVPAVAAAITYRLRGPSQPFG